MRLMGCQGDFNPLAAGDIHIRSWGSQIDCCSLPITHLLHTVLHLCVRTRRYRTWSMHLQIF